MKNKKLKKIILIAIAAVLVIVMGVVAMKITISNNKIGVLVAREEIGYNEEIKQSDESRFEIVQKNKDDLKQGYFDSFEALLTAANSYGYITESKILVGEVVYPEFFRVGLNGGSYYIPKVQYDDFTNPVVVPFDVSKAQFATNSIVKNQLAYITGNITEPISGKIYYGLLIKKMLVTNIIENSTEDGYSSLEVVVETSELDRITEIEKYGSNLKFVLANKTIVDQIDDTLEDVTKTYISNTGNDPIVKEYIPTSEKMLTLNSAPNNVWFFNDTTLDLTWRGKIDKIVVQHYDFNTGDRGDCYGVYTLGKEIVYNPKADEYSINKDFSYGFYVMDFYSETKDVTTNETTVDKKCTYTFAYEGVTSGTSYGFELENTKAFVFLDGDYNYFNGVGMDLKFQKDYFKNIGYFKDGQYIKLSDLSFDLSTVEKNVGARMQYVFTNISDNAVLDVLGEDYFTPKKSNQEPVTNIQINELEQYLEIGARYNPTGSVAITKYDLRIKQLMDSLRENKNNYNYNEMEKVIKMLRNVFSLCFSTEDTSILYNGDGTLNMAEMQSENYKADDYRVYVFKFLEKVFNIAVGDGYFQTATSTQKDDIKEMKQIVANYYDNKSATSSSVKIRIGSQEYEIYFSIIRG